MRVSKEVAEQNRRTVVEVAGKLFREQGFDGIGVASLMQAAGLTHGGFYKQFKDKQSLMAEASAAAMASNRIFWEQRLGATATPLQSFAEAYLSADHVDHVGEGCCFAALASEAPRHGEALQTVFGDGLESLADLIAPQADEAEALRTIATVVGALVLARAAGDHPVAERVLEAARAPE